MNKYAYAVLCGTDDVAFGVLCFNEFFKQTNPKYPLIVICPNTLKQETLLLLNQNGLNIYVVNAIEYTASDEYYNCVLNKFYCFTMTCYDKILYLDVDIILKKNLDFLFDEYPDSELWIFSNHDKDKHVGGNCFSVKPNLDYFKYLVDTYINTNLMMKKSVLKKIKKEMFLSMDIMMSRENISFIKFYALNTGLTII